MRYILSYLTPYYFHMIIAWSLMLIELSVELMLPFFLGKMIDNGILNQDLNVVIYWGSIMIGLAILSFVAGIGNSFYSSHVTYKFGYDIRGYLFDKVQSFSFKNLNEHPTSTLITRFTNDIRQIQSGLFLALRIMFRAPLLVIGGITMSFIVNWRIALIFLISVPILILLLGIIVKISSRLFTKVQGYLDKVNRVMQENLSGIRLIKAFLRSRHEKNRFVTANTHLMNETKTAFRVIEASSPILLLIMNLSLLFILWFGYEEINQNNAQVGEVVSIINYALRVSLAMNMFGFLTRAFARAKASSERLEHVFTTEVDLLEDPSVDQNQHFTAGNIQFNQVSFHYPNAHDNVLEDINLEIQAQEKVAILGATGSGKSTLFQLIPRLYDTSEGQLYIDHHPVQSYSFDQLRQSIGYVPQDPLLFTGTVFHNIAWGKNGASLEDVQQAAQDAQIHDTIASLPDGYQTKIGQKGVNLSGGQKQRISIARALIRKPTILMLDDSTSALDLKTEAQLLNAIDHYQCTTLIVTQKISTAMKADRVLLFDEGQLMAEGTHDHLLQQSTMYQQIVESQFGEGERHES
ncbi:ABC transporter ATP-binding protein [Alkalibacillus almallahensis]|uniref:ABC transporter ATP-binding protein n=1 Tax=Alkalibacillus almallahensis TaxID=1379154 RepID=UPI001421F749|nr:ABC transporter ATP-binding protein [Alkalibacillus almallahensis]NIK12029.1 ATP-binding cassette subfamily B protein [Alkalibacillus almallahensis]